MTGNTYRERFAAYAEKASEIARQLGFAGLGVVWIFKQDFKGKSSFPEPLVWPAFLIVVGLTIDLLHYSIGMLATGWAARGKMDDELAKSLVEVERWEVGMMAAKLLCIGVAAILLVRFLGLNLYVLRSR